MTRIKNYANVLTMNELKQTEENILEQPVNPGDASIFHDRHDGPFRIWMEGQGLAPDASDKVVIDAMRTFFETHNTHTITDYRHNLHR